MLMKKIHSQPRPSTRRPPISQAVVAPKPPSAPRSRAPCCARPVREEHGDDRERGRRHDRGPDPLEGAGADQRLVRPGEPAEKRSEREQTDADHEDPPPPEQVGGPPSEQEQAGEREGVGAHHPLQPLRREAEILLDRGRATVTIAASRMTMKKAPQSKASAHQRRGSGAGAGARRATGADGSIIDLRSRFQQSLYDPEPRRNSSVPASDARETATRTSGLGPTLRRWLSGAVRSGSSSRSRSAGVSSTGIRARPRPLRRPRSRRVGHSLRGRARAWAQGAGRAWRSPRGADRERARRRRSLVRSSEGAG